MGTFAELGEQMRVRICASMCVSLNVHIVSARCLHTWAPVARLHEADGRRRAQRSMGCAGQ